MLKVAEEVRSNFGSATASAATLLGMIEAEEAWDWANTPKMVMAIKKALAVVEGVTRDDEFIRTAVARDLTTLQKDLAASDFEVGLKKLVDSLKKPISDLMRETKLIHEQKRVRDQMSKDYVAIYGTLCCLTNFNLSAIWQSLSCNLAPLVAK